MLVGWLGLDPCFPQLLQRHLLAHAALAGFVEGILPAFHSCSDSFHPFSPFRLGLSLVL
jgi:hypothetical protein